jgi:hypothetical protein
MTSIRNNLSVVMVAGLTVKARGGYALEMAAQSSSLITILDDIGALAHYQDKSIAALATRPRNLCQSFHQIHQGLIEGRRGGNDPFRHVAIAQRWGGRHRRSR